MSNRLPSEYRLNIISEESEQNITNGSYQTEIYNLKWSNDQNRTNFIYEVDLANFSNNWAAFSFSENGKMVKKYLLILIFN